MIVIGKLVGKFCLKNDAVMQWHTQAVNITTDLKVEADFTLPTLSATNVLGQIII